MPGIVGIAGRKAKNSSFRKVLNSIKHEDSYKIDIFHTELFSIARVHLGIFNPEPQPIFNEDESLCIFMDGKIYDYEEELNKLKSKGHTFEISNDPEFCLHLFEEFGEDFTRKLNGAYLIVICDLKTNELSIFNDRYGLRPHYYTFTNNILIFAPEVKAILEYGGFPRELDDEAVSDFFAFGKIIGNKTLFKHIKVLPPASILKYDGDNLSIKTYWDFKFSPDYNTPKEVFVDELIKVFKKAVEIRLRDEHNYAVSLSGGLDSRSILAAINEDLKNKVLAYTFGSLDCDEIKIAKKVTKVAGVKHIIFEISPNIIIENAEKEVFLSDGLDYIGVSYILPIHKLIKERYNIDVVFDGIALGTLLGGHFLNPKLLEIKDKDELFEWIYGYIRLFSDSELSNLFLEDYYKKIKKFPLISLKKEFQKLNDPNPANFVDHFFLLNHIRRWTLGGHVLIHFNIETSVPTYDNDLIDLVLKIPPELRANNKIYRPFLKKLTPELVRIPYNYTGIRPDLPLPFWKLGEKYLRFKDKIKKLLWKYSKGRIFIKKKRGYVEFDEWFKIDENWKKYFKELLLSEKALIKRYIDQSYIRKLILEHERGNRNNSVKLLYVATFELFLRVFSRYLEDVLICSSTNS